MASRAKKNKLTKSKLSEKQIMKRKVRASAEWADLRKQVYEMQNGIDPVTLNRLTRGWALHHMDQREANYDNLDPERFLAVSHTHHEMLHWAYNIYKRTKSFDFLDALKEEILTMYEYSNDIIEGNQ